MMPRTPSMDGFTIMRGRCRRWTIFKGYVERYRLPISTYVDRRKTYESSKKLTEVDEVEGREWLSQLSER